MTWVGKLPWLAQQHGRYCRTGHEARSKNAPNLQDWRRTYALAMIAVISCEFREDYGRCPSNGAECGANNYHRALRVQLQRAKIAGTELRLSSLVSVKCAWFCFSRQEPNNVLRAMFCWRGSRCASEVRLVRTDVGLLVKDPSNANRANGVFVKCRINRYSRMPDEPIHNSADWADFHCS